MQTHTGIIVMLARKSGYGFIRLDDDQASETLGDMKDNREVFFTAVGLIDPPDFQDLREGAPVEFFLVESKRGLRAIGVVVQ